MPVPVPPPPAPRPTPEEVRAYYAARPAPLVVATGVVLDGSGRVLMLTPAHGEGLDLPGGTVADTEMPEEGLARELKEELGLDVPVGRLLAVDARSPGEPGRSLVAHVHLVGPLDDEQATGLSFAGGEAAEAHWHTPEEAVRLLPERVAPRLRAALAALYAGSIAHLVNGVPQPGSPAALDPARRAELEHAHALDAASHRASRPKAFTAAHMLFTDGEGRVLLVQPAYRQDGRWNLPGGGVDSDLGESPRDGARREVLEELGLEVAPGRLLAVNWTSHAPYPARVSFTFDGGLLTGTDLGRIRLPPAELREWRLAGQEELAGLVKPKLRRRIEACLGALREGTGPLELHAGRPWAGPGGTTRSGGRPGGKARGGDGGGAAPAPLPGSPADPVPGAGGGPGAGPGARPVPGPDAGPVPGAGAGGEAHPGEAWSS
ncbi:NUDIX hydrolase [Streptomyces sp. NPDC089799]|uniref:NUDIX hydrolase n=1 Tax=Streptomyces sp. NPDC089799 TaxID=3155066 RepID=UPI003422C8CD